MKLDSTISAVVTGGASGLGAATAKRLAAEGVKVALFDLDADRGEETARDIGGAFFTVDVTSDDSVAAGLEAAASAHGPARILVNCAGIAPAAKTVSKGAPHSLDLFEKVIQVNLIGSFRCIALAGTVMAGLDPLNEDGERGVVISTASVAAFEGQIGQVSYASSKAGVSGMTLPIARDFSNLGIRVMAIAPGIFLTPMLMGLPENVRQSLGEQVPFPSRLGRPEEFADLAVHICENEMLNGSTIRLDGAIRMAPR
ncbi:MAG: SDR family NAD(P)-dependent oxidoreductase [Pseudomonadota bacterium]